MSDLTGKKFGLMSLTRVFQSQQAGLVMVILVLGAVLTARAGWRIDNMSGEQINNFLNLKTIVNMMKDASVFAIMAVGATMVIISGGIDLSVGSIYALSGVSAAMLLSGPAFDGYSPEMIVLLSVVVCFGVGLLCGLANGLLVVGLGVHPFIITLGTMKILRGITFVTSQAASKTVPDPVRLAVNASLGLGNLKPIPMLVMIVVAVLGAVYLTKTVAGRHVFAVGGNVDASRYAGLRINRVLVGVYALTGLACGVAAFVGSGYFGAACSADGDGYELYVIASAVVGGASLMGGKGNAVNAMLGAILLAMIKQSMTTLHINSNFETIIIGCAIIVAVVLDQMSARLSAKRLVRASSEAPADFKMVS